MYSHINPYYRLGLEIGIPELLTEVLHRVQKRQTLTSVQVDSYVRHVNFFQQIRKEPNVDIVLMIKEMDKDEVIELVEEMEHYFQLLSILYPNRCTDLKSLMDRLNRFRGVMFATVEKNLGHKFSKMLAL